ncbi:MAG TPA: hypothetical protein VGR71_12360 [Nitrospira sp.]|nr:hypothetical protein [Nitrospira sp.]
MPKMSLNPDLAKQGGGGVEAGNYRVKSAKNQNIKTDYRPNQIYLLLDLATLDANFQLVREAEDQDLRLSYGAESLKHYRVGVAKDANDPDPVAKGDNPDEEGNTIVPQDSEPFNKSCAAMVFLESLKKQGFPVDVLNRGYAPDFAGMEFTLASYSPKECNEKFGTRLNTKPVKDKDDPTKTIDITYKVVTKWNNPNYLGQSSGSQQTSTGNATAPAQAPAGNTESGQELLTKAIKVVIDRKKGGEIKSEQAMTGFVVNGFTQSKLPAAKLSEVQALIKDGKAVALALQANGVPVAFNEDTGDVMPVTYPLAIPA